MKRLLTVLLLIALRLPLPSAFAGDAPQFLTAQELLARDEVAAEIELGEDRVPSIFSVVGKREITEYMGSATPSGGWQDRYAYRSDAVQDDLVAYAAHLLANGWEELQGPSDAVSGDIAYTKPSVDGEQALTVVVTYDAEGYVLIASKESGVAWVAGGWTPRMEELVTPKGLGEPHPLEGAGVPAAYTEASPLSIRDGRMAYIPFDDYTNAVFVRRLGANGDQDFEDDYEDDEGYEQYDPFGIVLGTIPFEDGLICLADVDDEEFNTMVEILRPSQEPLSITGGFPEEAGAQSLRSFGGPLLELADGTLLFGDKYGAIHICKADGSSLRTIPGVRADDFVYYDGFVYFANLNDLMTHRGVYDMNASEYADFSYPRLYRARLDGSGPEKLTDCGVRGLTSQGPFVIYQNLDEPFSLPVFEQTGPEILYGPLYCYNADTDEHRAMGIQSNRYLPTPWGLAVWYHDFAFEPYDVSAELVLHDYDGAPLYKLDAGGTECIGDACVYRDALCFHSYNWSFDWGESDEAELFSVVPLDGGPKGDLTTLLGYVQIDDITIPLDAKAVELSELYLWDDALASLQRLTNLRELTADMCDITDLGAIGRLTDLESLSLFGNEIEDLSPLANLKNLRSLDLALNEVKNLTALATLTNLQKLNLSDNPIEDVSPLHSLANLEELYLYDIGVPEDRMRGQIEALAERLPRAGIFCDAVEIPRLIDDRMPDHLGQARPLAGDGVPAEAMMGASIAVQGDRIAYVRSIGDKPTLHVLRRQEGAYVLEAEYTADQPISNVILHGNAVAYLTGPTNYASPDAVCTLEIGMDGESVYSMLLGPSRRARAPYVGPMALLPEERLLFADNLGALYTCDMEGSNLERVGKATAGDFAYLGGKVYFESSDPLDTLSDVYCRELDEYCEMSYPLLSVTMDNVEDRALNSGIQGLASWGGKIVYQNMEDAFVFPYGELPEDWLKGMLYLYDTENDEAIPLGIASSRYVATPYGIAAWHGVEDGEEHEISEAKLVLYDYEGNALHALDAQGLEYAQCFVSEREIWFVRYEVEERNGEFEYVCCLVRVPLDGGAAEVYAVP